VDNICKGDLITKRGWDPKSFVRVGWVHYYDGLVAFAGIDQKAEPYVTTNARPSQFIPWVKPVEFNFNNDDVLELVGIDGVVIRRSLVVDVMPGKDTFFTRDITDRGLESQALRSIKQPTGGKYWRKSTMKVLTASVPTQFITEFRTPKKGERYLGHRNETFQCEVIVGEVK